MLEKFLNWTFKLVGALIILWMLGLVLALLGFTSFLPLLDSLGLNLVGDRGILVNCSKPENQKSEFCISMAKRAAQKRTGRKGGDDSRLGEVEKGPAIPFSLSN